MLTHNLGSYLTELVEKLPHRPFYLVDVSPETYPQLRSIVSVRLPILARFCDKTLFINPHGNRVMRAVHDTVHLALEATTSVFDEWRVAVEQSRLIGHFSAYAATLLYADFVGQTEYIGVHGEFPTDQVAFTFHYLETGSVKEVF